MPTKAYAAHSRTHAVDVLSRKLAVFGPLTPEDVSLLQAAVGRCYEAPRGAALDAEKRQRSGVVVSGWLGRLRSFSDGRRQVVSTLIVGELFGVRNNPFVSASMVALTDAQVADISGVLDAVDREPRKHQTLNRAFDLAARLEEAQMVEHVVRLGARSALERMAHWLLDLQQRLELAGLCEAKRFKLPITQVTMCDILGVSNVHINRVLKQLRDERLIDFRGGEVTIIDAERLNMMAEFTPLPVDGLGKPMLLER